MKTTLFFILFLPWMAWSQHSNAIAYNVLENPETDDYEIYIMDPDGKHPRNLTNHPAVDWVYHAQGNRIYFLSDRDACARCLYLYEMDVTTGDLQKLTDFQLADSWFSSRNQGGEFVVRPAKNTFSGVYIINRKGEVLQRVPIDLPYVNDPAFSPDGSAIVFRGANKASPRELGFSDALYVMDLPSGKPQKITTFPETASDAQWKGYLAAAPRWRKDGMITFASKTRGTYDIYEISKDGSGLRRVTETENNEVFHDWSVEGDLVFEASMNNHDGYELYLKKRGGEILQLTHDDLEQYAPVFVKMD